MELKEFVSDVLSQIREGISDAIGKHPGIGAGAISPAFQHGDSINWRDYIRDVEFDVAVTATDKAQGVASGGIKVLSVFNATADGSLSSEFSTASRIKFSVAMLFPPQVIVPTPKPTRRQVEGEHKSWMAA